MIVAALAVAACGGKRDDAGRGSAEAQVAPAKPIQCPAGNAVQDGACVVVVTPETLAVVATQKTRIDELAAVLDKVDLLGAPIELLDGMRQLEAFQQLKARIGRLALLDAAAAQLDNAVRTLRTFKSSLGEASTRIGDLERQLDQLMTQTGAAQKLDDARAQVSTSVRAALEPLAGQVVDAIHNALVPLDAKLNEAGRMLITGCTMSELSGGGAPLKALCAQAEDRFAKGRAYLEGVKDKPAAMFRDVSTQLELKLDTLVDAQTRKLLDEARAKVSAARAEPAAGAQ